MSETPFTPPAGAFTCTVTIRFSHCDPAGIVYFPHYFDMFNGLIEDWYKDLGIDNREFVLNARHGFPFVHIECDFMVPSRMGELLDLTLLVQRVGRSSLSLVIVGHHDGVMRLRARTVSTMVSLDTMKAVEFPPSLREKLEGYQARIGPA